MRTTALRKDKYRSAQRQHSQQYGGRSIYGTFKPPRKRCTAGSQKLSICNFLTCNAADIVFRCCEMMLLCLLGSC